MKNEYLFVEHTFNPIYDSESRILILGSFPSFKSRENSFYYMNKQNRFWKVLSSIYDVDFTKFEIYERINELKKMKIALYDVIYSCEIKGSSDVSIRNVTYSNIDKIIKDSHIEKILLNGKKAYELFIKRYPHYEKISFCLPSTSPANAGISIDELVRVWKSVLE